MFVLKLVNPRGLRFSIKLNDGDPKEFPANSTLVDIPVEEGKLQVSYVNPNDTLQHRQVISFDNKSSKHIFGDGHILERTV